MVLCIKSSGPSDYLSPPSPRRCVFPLVIVSIFFFPTFAICIFKDSFLIFFNEREGEVILLKLWETIRQKLLFKADCQ